MPSPRRRRRPARFWDPGLVIVMGGAMVLAAVAIIVVLLAPAPTVPPPFSYVNGTLMLGSAAAYESRQYFSLNTASPVLASPSVEALVGATGITYENSGYPAESVNQSANLQYSDAGIASPYMGENDTLFIELCDKVHCHASLPLPGEIDDPGAAAVTVRYVEQTLGFHPSYWEVGNEPASWTHFGIPWARWSPSDKSTPTPFQYAEMVQRYVLAVHSVDPTARILGIQSDAGAPSRSVWFSTLMQIDGPNLSAVAYHSYPGGVGTPSESLSQFFSTLSQPGSFPLNYPLTQATVDAACPGCSTELFVGEYNSARLGNLSGYASSYPEAPYIAAGLLKGLEENASQVTFYGLQPGGASGLLDAQGDPLPVYYDYSTFFQNLALPWVNNATVVGGPEDVYALISHNTSRVSEMIVNTDTSVGLNLSFGPGTAFNGPAQLYLYGPRLDAPTQTTLSLNASSVIQVPPEGVVLIDGAPPPAIPAAGESGHGPLGTGPSGRGPQAGLASLPTVGGGAAAATGERTAFSRSRNVS